MKMIERCRYFAKFDPHAIEGGSVGCGHWNQFLACIVDSRPVPERFRNDLCEPGNPCLDGARLSRDQPPLTGLLTDGLKFTMIKYEVEVEFPETPNIFQKALNIEHHIGEGSMYPR